MLTPERRAFLLAAYSTLLRPSAPAEDQPPAPPDEADHPKPKDDKDSQSRKGETGESIQE
jgi:hypothetical protein